MRQLTTGERKAGQINGSIYILRQELKKDRRRHRLHRIKEEAKEGLLLFILAAPFVAVWVAIINAVLTAKGY